MIVLTARLNIEDLDIAPLLSDLEKRLKDIYDNKLKKVLLYGSYAKGDNVEGSDVDIMVLVDMEDKEIKRQHDKILDTVVDLTTQYGIVLSIIENNYDHFYKWADVLPFFSNIEREVLFMVIQKHENGSVKFHS